MNTSITAVIDTTIAQALRAIALQLAKEITADARGNVETADIEHALDVPICLRSVVCDLVSALGLPPDGEVAAIA